MPYGTGKYTYELVDGWAKLPEGWSFLDVGGVSIDSQDRVYIFNRSDHPIIVLDREGNFLTSWGEGLFRRPHGSGIGPDTLAPVRLAISLISPHTCCSFSYDGLTSLMLAVCAMKYQLV